jgi:hypothetical protein
MVFENKNEKARTGPRFEMKAGAAQFYAAPPGFSA